MTRTPELTWYIRDGIKLYLGDCRDVLPTLDRTKIGAVIFDPPYGMKYESGWASSWSGTQIEGDASTATRDFVLEWASGLAVACFGTWRIASPTGTRTRLIWDKGPASGMGDLRLPWKTSYETIDILGAGWSGSRDEGVLRGHRIVTWESKGRCHPNEKPTALLSELIAKAPPGIILDPTCGSGSTLLAARNMGREAIGIECDEKWYSIACQRIAQGSLF